MTLPTVIVPTLGRHRDRLAALLDSLEHQTVPRQTIVIDNGSPGGAATRLCERFPAAESIRLEENEGFSRAVNIAARRADGNALVLVNDDCLCDPEFVERIVSPLDPGAGIVMVAGVLRDPSNSSRIDTAGVQIDRTLLAFNYLGGEPLSKLDDEPLPPMGPSGAAGAFDREAFLAVGGFDERLFAYWEDVDLALRLHGAGGHCGLAPRARGTHEHSSTLGAGSPTRNYLMGFGRGYVLRKWGALTPSRLVPVVARDTVVCLGQLSVDHNVAGIRGRIRGFRAGQHTETYPDELVREGLTDGTWRSLRRRATFSAMLRARSRIPENGHVNGRS